MRPAPIVHDVIYCTVSHSSSCYHCKHIITILTTITTSIYSVSSPPPLSFQHFLNCFSALHKDLRVLLPCNLFLFSVIHYTRRVCVLASPFTSQNIHCIECFASACVLPLRIGNSAELRSCPDDAAPFSSLTQLSPCQYDQAPLHSYEPARAMRFPSTS